VADALNFFHVNTGSIYRAFTWKVLEEGLDPYDTASVITLIKRVRCECDFIEQKDGPPRIRTRLDRVDPGSAIRTPRVEQFVSVIAAIPQVREWMVQKQRQLAQLGNLVVEGRDIGTVVFPETPFKFYLDADPEVRAQRRAIDQGVSEAQVGVKEVSQAIAERDLRDRTRTVAPLKVAKDAIRIDTSLCDAQTVADLVLKHIRSKHLANS